VTRPTLADRVVAVDRALDREPHAFGGALALAYYAEPRATVDIDVNVFVPVERFPEIADRLVGIGARADDPSIATLIGRDGQARVMWDDVPLDLFLSYDPFHDAAEARRRMVPFGDGTIPVLAPEHLLVCKAVFDRPRDWVDIDAVLADGVDLDVAEILRWVGRIAGDEDRRFDRIATLLATR
jgi:hypothetical protein